MVLRHYPEQSLDHFYDSKLFENIFFSLRENVSDSFGQAVCILLKNCSKFSFTTFFKLNT